jgi:hypothetical protein
MQTILFPPQQDIFLEVVTGAQPQPWVFFAPHENEQVVNQHLSGRIREHGGVFVILRQHGERHIQLSIDDNLYEVDPNRIFTDRGRSNTLLRLNLELKTASEQYLKALARAESLAEFILDTMDAEQATSWIATHNNTNGYADDGNNGRGTISIKRYQKKLDSGANYLIQVHDANIDEDDLFFVTELSDLKIMADANWNVVLQNPNVAVDPLEDDGSLSVLAEMQGKRYINIEAERSDDGFGEDHLAEQKAMVDLTFQILMSER